MAVMIRMAQVAKHLGISSQDLRKLLLEVNLGVKATDREVDENLAAGIVRFASRRLKIKCDPLIKYDEKVVDDEETAGPQEEGEEKEKKLSSALNQLHDIAEKSKKDIVRKREEDRIRIEKEKKDKEIEEEKSKKKLSILRKIEISPEAAAAAK